MRRILENFFRILGGTESKVNESLIDKFDSPEDKKICRSFID